MYTVITLPHFFDGEAEVITQKFQCGLQRLHLRKPESTADECRALLRQIPGCYHSRIVVHDHFELAEEFGLHGVHLNRRHPEPPEGWRGSVSCSCHNLEELQARKAETWHVATEEGRQEKMFDYLSLSPIFDSISKNGYHAAFTPEQLSQAHADGIIDERVMALGGVCSDNVDEALGYGFGGVMVLGDAWKETSSPEGREVMPIVLTIAGSDPSAGAGIQQDLKTITNCGCYGATVITALTSQNTMGVQGVMPVPAEVVESQLRSVFSDLRIAAVKIGMIPNKDVARVIVRVLEEERRKRVLPIVCDPIMISTSGTCLMDEDCIGYVVQYLFPLCTLVTPNLPEYGKLRSVAQVESLPLLLKGGHAEGNDMTDTLYIPAEGLEQRFSSPRIFTRNLHGTGCTLSSAIACQLAQNKTLQTAVAEAKSYITCAIEGARNLNIGHGNGPLWYKIR